MNQLFCYCCCCGCWCCRCYCWCCSIWLFQELDVCVVCSSTERMSDNEKSEHKRLNEKWRNTKRSSKIYSKLKKCRRYCWCCCSPLSCLHSPLSLSQTNTVASSLFLIIFDFITHFFLLVLVLLLPRRCSSYTTLSRRFFFSFCLIRCPFVSSCAMAFSLVVCVFFWYSLRVFIFCYFIFCCSFVFCVGYLIVVPVSLFTIWCIYIHTPSPAWLEILAGCVGAAAATRRSIHLSLFHSTQY